MDNLLGIAAFVCGASGLILIGTLAILQAASNADDEMEEWMEKNRHE